VSRVRNIASDETRLRDLIHRLLPLDDRRRDRTRVRRRWRRHRWTTSTIQHRGSICRARRCSTPPRRHRATMRTRSRSHSAAF